MQLLPDERALLLDLLEKLTAEEWSTPTVCPGWSVKDIGSHLLGDDVGILSGGRDGHRYDAHEATDDRDDESWDGLVAWLNEWNESWVRSMRRISPRVLRDLLKFSGDEVVRHFNSIDHYDLGRSVSWAGPDPAPVWLDIAREYTERWVHQQQIRDALNRPGLKERRYLAPVLDTFVRALPHTFRDVPAEEGTAVQLVVIGESGGTWTLLREGRDWNLYEDTVPNPDCAATIDQDTAWRLFTRGISKGDALVSATIEGNRHFGLKVLDTVSIIA